MFAEWANEWPLRMKWQESFLVQLVVWWEFWLHGCIWSLYFQRQKVPCLCISRLLKAVLNFAVKMRCAFHTFMVLRLGTVNLLSLGLAEVSFGRECNSSSLVLSRSSVAQWLLWALCPRVWRTVTSHFGPQGLQTTMASLGVGDGFNTRALWLLSADRPFGDKLSSVLPYSGC